MPTKAELTEKLAQTEAELVAARRLAIDRRYFMEAYHSMLGENGLKVAAMWEAKNVKRVHHSWGPEAHKLTGEERAAFILDWEEAARTAVPVESIDGL